MKNEKINKVLFGWLFLASLFGSLMGVPSSIAILGESSTVWLSVIAEVLFLALASAVGVRLSEKVGLGSRLRDLVSGIPESRKHLLSALAIGMIVGIILGTIGYFAQNALPESALIPGLKNPSIFQWFLRCLSAALTEEIFFRFGLMTLFVWIIRSIIKKQTFYGPSLWIGNLLSALIFAGLHLPQLTFHGWSLLVPFVIFSSFAGMVMGWLFMRYGLVSAIVAHFIGDLIVYVFPRVFSIIV